MSNLPNELMEVIIIEALSGVEDGTETGSSQTSGLGTVAAGGTSSLESTFALVGHRWRYHVNARRFSTVTLNVHTSLTCLEGLVDLIVSHRWPEREGVVQHIHELSFCPDTPSQARTWYQDEYVRRNRSIATILGQVFGDGLPALYSKAKKTKTFKLGADYKDDEDGEVMFSFEDMHIDVASALDVLLRRPGLTILHVENAAWLPVELLRHPNLIELHLSDLIFKPSADSASIFKPSIFPNLQVLTLHFVPDFFDMVLPTPTLLPKLTNLTIGGMPKSQDLEEIYLALYQIGQSVRKLTVQHYIEDSDPFNPAYIDYMQFKEITELHLTIEDDARLADLNSNSDSFVDIPSLLPKRLPPNMRLDIFYNMCWDDELELEASSYAILHLVDSGRYLQLARALNERLAQAESSSVKIFLCVSICSVRPRNRAAAESFRVYLERLARHQFNYFNRIDRVTMKADVELKMDLRRYDSDSEADSSIDSDTDTDSETE